MVGVGSIVCVWGGGVAILSASSSIALAPTPVSPICGIVCVR